MTDTKIETSTISTTTVERHSSPVICDHDTTDEVFYASSTLGHVDGSLLQHQQHQHIEEFSSPMASMDASQTAFRHLEAAQCSSSTHALDQLVGQRVSGDMSQYSLNKDPCPEHIRRHNNERVTYQQDVSVRYLQPPTPPPPGPVIVREIRAPALPEAPPLVIRQRPPVPMTPPPLIIREQPPVPPPVVPSRIVNKYLPAPPPPPRKVIIERQEPLPPKPQPVIIEKWLPYQAPPQQRVIVESAPPLIPRPQQKNTVITYDAPHVDVVKKVHDLGVMRVDPHMYAAQYGSKLASNDYVLNTMSRFGVGNNYLQMIQMQAANQSLKHQQSMGYGDCSSTRTYQAQLGDQCHYVTKHVEETIRSDGSRKIRSSVSGSDEREVLRQASLVN